MSERFSNRITLKRRRGRFAWVLGVVALVAGLLYWEQVEILYVLSVLAMCAFLLVVAFSHLDKDTPQAAATTQEGSEAAPAVGGTTASVTPALVKRSPATWRRRGAA